MFELFNVVVYICRLASTSSKYSTITQPAAIRCCGCVSSRRWLWAGFMVSYLSFPCMAMTSTRRLGSGPQSNGLQDLNEKLPYSKPAGGKTNRLTYINYITGKTLEIVTNSC